MSYIYVFNFFVHYHSGTSLFSRNRGIPQPNPDQVPNSGPIPDHFWHFSPDPDQVRNSGPFRSHCFIVNWCKYLDWQIGKKSSIVTRNLLKVSNWIENCSSHLTNMKICKQPEKVSPTNLRAPYCSALLISLDN